MNPAFYSACPHCQGPVDITKAARRGALDIITVVLFALSDSAIVDPRAALERMMTILQHESKDELDAHLWPLESVLRQAAIRALQEPNP